MRRSVGSRTLQRTDMLVCVQGGHHTTVPYEVMARFSLTILSSSSSTLHAQMQLYPSAMP